MDAKIEITNTVLETERLILRPWKESDLQDFFEYASVDGVGQMAGWLPHESIEQSRDILSRFIAHKHTFALELKENGKVIGSLGIESSERRQLPEPYTSRMGRELGYVLSKDYWGRGLMTEAVQRVIPYCFENCGCEFLTINYYQENRRSARVAEKNGFRLLLKTPDYPTVLGKTTSCLTILEKREWEILSAKMRKPIIVTGFQPFGGDTVNPSYEAVRLLPDAIGGFELVKMELPVVFGKAADKLLAAIEEIRPAAVISVGQAGGRDAVTPELIAVNLMNARIPDNDGNQPLWEPISKDSADGIFSRLPVNDFVNAINAAGLPAKLSYSAGAYVCNDLFYRILNATKESGLICGFIHVPFEKSQVADRPDAPAMELTDISKALGICIECLAKRL